MPLHRIFILRQEQQTEALIAFVRANASAMALAGTPLAVEVGEHKARRSLEQNNRLHALLTDVAAHAWVDGKQYDMETWKEFFRRKYIGIEEYVFPDGTRSERGISTTTLTVENFGKFMDSITEYATDHLAVEFAL